MVSTRVHQRWSTAEPRFEYHGSAMIQPSLIYHGTKFYHDITFYHGLTPMTIHSIVWLPWFDVYHGTYMVVPLLNHEITMVVVPWYTCYTGKVETSPKVTKNRKHRYIVKLLTCPIHISLLSVTVRWRHPRQQRQSELDMDIVWLQMRTYADKRHTCIPEPKQCFATCGM